MSTYEVSDRNVVAEDLAEYGLVLLADGEPPSPALSALKRGVAADAEGHPYSHHADDEEGSFVFVIPWYSRSDRRRAATGRPAASALT